MKKQINTNSSNTVIEYPVRINRYLYLNGVCSRRAADRLIEQNEVHINGKIAELGQKVNKNDKVTLGSEAKKLQDSYKYYIYNKPVGVVSHNPQMGEKEAVRDAGLEPDPVRPGHPGGFAPVGRLDKASSGLMLLTNDGRIVNRLLNPEFAHKREYVITLDKPIKNHDIKLLGQGVDIEGYKTRPAEVTRLDDKKIMITLTEGKKHQIRRMCAALGYQVQSLKRTAMMHLVLGALSSSRARELTSDEQEALLTKLGMVQ